MSPKTLVVSNWSCNCWLTMIQMCDMKLCCVFKSWWSKTGNTWASSWKRTRRRRCPSSKWIAHWSNRDRQEYPTLEAFPQHTHQYSQNRNESSWMQFRRIWSSPHFAMPRIFQLFSIYNQDSLILPANLALDRLLCCMYEMLLPLLSLCKYIYYRSSRR